jgi:putative Mg2+ transporter-C (MgtC) family protein
MGAALLLGAAMGVERQWRHRMAGPRTNALVASAAAAFAMIGLIDPGTGNASRIVGQIVTGVGFLGAGVIFREGANVHGLNTAATVWCAAAVGALSGVGYPLYSVALAVAAILTNVALRPLSYKLQPDLEAQDTNYIFQLTCSAKDETRVRALLLGVAERNGVSVTSINSEDLETGDRVRVNVSLRAPGRNDQCMEQLVAQLSLEPSVSAVRWRVETPVVD